VELFTLNRKFLRQDTIDKFLSAVWTERYYGDSETVLTVPGTPENAQKFKAGTFLGSVDSDEIMILESLEFDKDGSLKVSGISLLKWLNNRFLRSSSNHEDRYWTIEGVPGQHLINIVYYTCIGGPFLDGTTPIGVTNPQSFIIPGLKLGDWDMSGTKNNIAVPYGPVWDALFEVATTYQIGQQIILNKADDAGYELLYRNYRGLRRTSDQSVNPVVRFSKGMGSLTDIEEVQSISNYKTLVYSYAPANPGGLATTPGFDGRTATDTPLTGFDLRAKMVFCEDITTDQVNGNAATLLSILNARAKDELTNHPFIKVVDGEIVPGIQFKYGVHFNLGDVIELQGNSGVINNARVTEFIRTQDESGEKAYPTVAVIE
jgi:hypothetical protein